MKVYHCDWCGVRIENPVQPEVEFERERYDMCGKHWEEYHQLMEKIRKRFEAEKVISP